MAVNAMPGSFSRQERGKGYVLRAFHLNTISRRNCMLRWLHHWAGSYSMSRTVPGSTMSNADSTLGPKAGEGMTAPYWATLLSSAGSPGLLIAVWHIIDVTVLLREPKGTSLARLQHDAIDLP